MINATQAQQAENEIALGEEESRKQKHHDTSYKADKDGNYTILSGRGGAGNIRKTRENPALQTPMEPADESPSMSELRPVYSIGRGGAGNMVRTKKSKSSKWKIGRHTGAETPSMGETSIKEELSNGISPVHSGASGKSYIDTLRENSDSNKGHKFVRKLKKLFGGN